MQIHLVWRKQPISVKIFIRSRLFITQSPSLLLFSQREFLPIPDRSGDPSDSPTTPLLNIPGSSSQGIHLNSQERTHRLARTCTLLISLFPPKVQSLRVSNTNSLHAYGPCSQRIPLSIPYRSRVRWSPVHGRRFLFL